MPLILESWVLLIVTYLIGLAIGWLVWGWGNTPQPVADREV